VYFILFITKLNYFVNYLRKAFPFHSFIPKGLIVLPKHNQEEVVTKWISS